MSIVQPHFVYGLYDRADVPRTVLYVGSTVAANWRHRLAEHRAGRCRTTAKMARKHRVPLKRLAMLLLDHWTTGHSSEGRIIKHYRKLGQAPWNKPYPFNADTLKKGVEVRRKNGTLGAASKKMLADGTHPFLNQTPEMREKRRLTMRRNGTANAAIQSQIKRGTAVFSRGSEASKKRVATMRKNGTFGNSVRVAAAKGTNSFQSSLVQKKMGLTRKMNGTARRAGLLGAHSRWHIMRGAKIASCSLCQDEEK